MPDAVQTTSVDLDAAARTLYGEARGEPIEGQRGVAWVLRNRLENPGWWGRTLAQVCYATEQFSCWLTSDPNRDKCLGLLTDDPEYLALYEVVRSVMAGEVDDPTGGADHYEVTGTPASWIRGRAPTAVIGKQSFYRIGLSG